MGITTDINEACPILKDMHFNVEGDLTMQAAAAVYFRASTTYINSASSGVLSLIGTTVAVTGAATFSSTVGISGVTTITKATDPQLVVKYDANNYANIGVSSAGACKVTAVGSSDSIELETGDGKIILDAKTDIDLDPEGADINLLGAAAGKITLGATSVSIYGGDTTADTLVLYGSSADTTSATLTGGQGLVLAGTLVTALGIGACTTAISLTGAQTTGILVANGYTGIAVKVGTLSSTTPGSGVILTDANTRAMEVHVDDNNAALLTATCARAILGRAMFYADASCEQFAIHGLAKWSAVAKTGNVTCGVMGAFETTGTCSTATGAGNTYVAGVMGRIGTGGAVTLGAGTSASCVLAFGNNAQASAFSGAYYYAFSTALSATATMQKFDYGLYMTDASISAGVYVGTGCGTALNLAGCTKAMSATVATVSGNYGMSVIATCTSGHSEGIAGYFEAHTAGTPDGLLFGVGTWVNVDSAPGAREIRGLDCGVYAQGQNLTGATIYSACFQTYADAANPPGANYMLRFNCNQGGSNPTGWFFAANQECVAHTADTNSGANKTGAIKIVFQDLGARYIRVYDNYN